MKTDTLLSAGVAVVIHALAFFAFTTPRDLPRLNRATPPAESPVIDISVLPFDEPVEPDPILPEDVAVAHSADAPQADDYVDAGKTATPGRVPLRLPDLIGDAASSFTQTFQPNLNGMGNGLLLPAGGWSGAPGGVLSLDGLDDIPRVVHQVSPHYPPQLRREGIEGEVVVTFVVDMAGRVITAQVEQGSRTEFAREALAAIKRWRFEPGTRRGQPVRFRMSLPVVFSLSGT